MIADSNRLFRMAVFAAILVSCLAGCAGSAVTETKPYGTHQSRLVEVLLSD